MRCKSEKDIGSVEDPTHSISHICKRAGRIKLLKRRERNKSGYCTREEQNVEVGDNQCLLIDGLFQYSS
jgi:hypothetical protein